MMMPLAAAAPLSAEFPRRPKLSLCFASERPARLAQPHLGYGSRLHGWPQS
jgi:hypothetical protein